MRLLGALLVFTLAGASRAADDGEGPFSLPVDVHAFVSQGYMITTESNYIAHSRRGTFEFTEVGINFTKNISDDLRVGMQLFSRDLPDVEELQGFLRANAWQPIELWPEPNQKILRDKGRVDADGRVHLVGRPDQIVPIVCGGLGSLHAIALPSFGESQMQSHPVLRPGSA